MKRLTEMNENKTAHFYPQCFDNCGGTGYSQNCDDCDLLDRVCDKLGEYEDLEEQGKLLKLPCAVGDTVYFLCREHFGDYFAEKHGDIISVEVKNILFSNRGFGINFDVYELLLEDIGKTVFLTKESAEAALKEMSK